MARRPTIAIRNLTSRITDADLISATAAIQKQISNDFAAAWGIDASLRLLRKEDLLASDNWFVGLFDDADHAGALGYYDLTRHGQPLGKVFVPPDSWNTEAAWTVDLSHQLLELLVDPNVNLCAFDQDNRRLYAYDICDPVRAPRCGYDIAGTIVSDFVLPGWFEPGRRTESNLAFKSKVTVPLQLLAGGEIGCFDFDGTGWQQIVAHELTDARVLSNRNGPSAPYSARARVGSRRERRRIPKSQWLRSAAG
jgi:hypothetical protein